MPKAERTIPGLPDRYSRLKTAMAVFRELQSDYEACLSTDNPKSPPVIKDIATSQYLIPSTLQRRFLEQTQPLKEAHTQEQRLTEAEESTLAKWVGLMQIWGWPPRICQVRRMATRFLIRRGVNVLKKPLGIHWIQNFVSRHPFLESGWSASIEHDRLRFNKYEGVLSWFSFWQKVKERYDFDICVIYNMDEKGFAQGVLGTLRIMCDRRLRKDTKALIAHCGKREWVSAIENMDEDDEGHQGFGRYKYKQPLVFSAKRRHTTPSLVFEVAHLLQLSLVICACRPPLFDAASVHCVLTARLSQQVPIM